MHPTEDLTALADGALGPARADAVRRHLAGCAACAAEEQRLLDALAVLRDLPPAPAPSQAFAARVQARVEEEQRRRGGWLARIAGLRWRLAVPAGALAAAALATTLSIRQGHRREWAVAEHLELLDDYEAVASLGDVTDPDDALVIAHLDQLEREVRR